LFSIHLIDNDVRQGSEGGGLASHEGPEQDSVGAEGQKGARRDPRLKPDLVTNDLANLEWRKVTCKRVKVNFNV
jgi:hypothetical protein